MLPSCKTKSMVDYHYDGSWYDKTDVKHDTSYVDVERWSYLHDTTIVTMHDTTIIRFVDGGGVYDTKSGVMSGVTSVTKTEHSASASSSVSVAKADSTASSASESSLTDSGGKVSVDDHEEKSSSYSFPWWLLLVGIGIGAVGIVALKKLPYTKILMQWL